MVSVLAIKQNEWTVQSGGVSRGGCVINGATRLVVVLLYIC